MRALLIILAWLGYTNYSYGQDGFIEGVPRLAYWQIGQSKETVIVLHGGGGAPHQYLRPEFDALTQTAKIIYYDQRGCGKSDTSLSYIWQNHVADLRRLIQTLVKDQKVFLAGSSWGSTLAILYAYTHPEDVKGLILSGTMPWKGEEQVFERNRFYPTKVIKMPMVENRIVTKLTTEGQVKRDTIKVSKEVEIYSGLPSGEPIVSQISAPKAERLKAVRVPILLFNGTYNRRWDWVDEYVKLFPNVQLHTLPETGHDSWFGAPDLFFSISNDFIRDVSK